MPSCFLTRAAVHLRSPTRITRSLGWSTSIWTAWVAPSIRRDLELHQESMEYLPLARYSTPSTDRGDSSSALPRMVRISTSSSTYLGSAHRTTFLLAFTLFVRR